MSPKGDRRHATRRGKGRNEDVARLVREVVGPEEAAERAEPPLREARERAERAFVERRDGGGSS